MAFINIKGVIPPMITPFDEDDKVDYGKFIRNIEKWNYHSSSWLRYGLQRNSF